jgi:hypothetical protein
MWWFWKVHWCDEFKQTESFDQHVFALSTVRLILDISWLFAIRLVSPQKPHKMKHSFGISSHKKKKKDVRIHSRIRRELPNNAHMHKTWTIVEILRHFIQFTRNGQYHWNFTCKSRCLCCCLHADFRARLHHHHCCIIETAWCDEKEGKCKTCSESSCTRLEWIINWQRQWTSWFIHNWAIVVDISYKSSSSELLLRQSGRLWCNGLS